MKHKFITFEPLKLKSWNDFGIVFLPNISLFKELDAFQKMAQFINFCWGSFILVLFKDGNHWIICLVCHIIIEPINFIFLFIIEMFSKTSVHSKILKLRSLAKASAIARAMSTSVAQPKVITEYLSDEVFEFVMNNPRKHNAIDLDMYDMLWQQLRKWENQEQPTPKVIFVKGAGGQAFACGGDVVSIYEGSLVGQHAPILTEFFYKEYILDYALTQMKPIQISVWNGIVMGGGVGISSLSPIRIATEKTIYAMPETAIGFFTDVGGSYFLSRLNNNISLGLFLGITGHRLKAKDLLKWGVATNYVETSNLPSLYEDVVKHTTQDTSLEEIKEIVDRYSDNDVSEVTIPEETINYCFAPKPIHTIVQRLTEVVQGEVEGLDSDFASYWLEAIRKFSPIS